MNTLRGNIGWLLMGFGVLLYVVLIIAGCFDYDDGRELWLNRFSLPLLIFSFLCCLSGPFLMTHYGLKKRAVIFIGSFTGYCLLATAVAMFAYFLEGFGIGI